jgi:hypothetical protein
MSQPEHNKYSTSHNIKYNDRDALAYARRGLTLLVLGRDADAAPDLAGFRALVPHMWPYLQRVIELARNSQGGTPPAPPAGESGVLSARLIDGVFAGSA